MAETPRVPLAKAGFRKGASVDVSQLLELARDAGLAADALLQDLLAALARGTTAGVATAREESRPPFFGELANSIVARGPQIRESGATIVIDDLISTSTAHSIVMEEGRRPGARLPPLGPIRRWVRLKVRRGDFDLDWTGRDDEAEAIEVAAIFLASSIAHRGIEGRHFMAKGAAAAEGVLQVEIEKAADQLHRRIEL